MKFTHLADCHLGSWRQPELRELNFKSFQYAIDFSISQKVNFILIAGDLFDTAYPSIEILKKTFAEFKKLKDADIPVFLIAGSHDYSVSGKSFLDVLETAGFCKNVAIFEERNGKIILQPTIYKNIAIYGYPGKKSCLEVDEIAKISLQDSPGLFRILMLHTTISGAIGTAPIKSVDETTLPKVDYLALGHLHINFSKENLVYSGPTFPNNISEIEELGGGSFYLFEDGKINRHEIVLKSVESIHLEVTSTLQLTEQIISLLNEKNINDKIVLLRLFGIIEKGKISDIDFQKIEDFVKKKGAYAFLKTTSKLFMAETEKDISFLSTENLEEDFIKKFKEKNPSKFNKNIHSLISVLQAEKLEDETTSSFEERLFSEAKKILEI